MKTIWNKETGEARGYESVDAREILRNSPDVYTDVDPNPPKKDKDGNLRDKDGNVVGAGPQNVANVENEFRREPVGDDVPAKEREGVIIRNPVTDQPRMAPSPATQPGTAEREARGAPVDLDDMTIPELKEHAASRRIDLGDAHLKADIIKKIKRA